MYNEAKNLKLYIYNWARQYENGTYIVKISLISLPICPVVDEDSS